MSEKMDNVLKVFDELFDELVNENFDDSKESCDDFKVRMKSRLNDAAVDNGYTDFEKMVDVNDENSFYSAVSQSLEKIKSTANEVDKEIIAKYQKMITTDTMDDILSALNKETDSGTIAAIKELVSSAKESQLALLNRDMQKVVEKDSK